MIIFDTIEQHHPFKFASAQRNQAATTVAGLDTSAANQTGGGQALTNQNQVFRSALIPL